MQHVMNSVDIFPWNENFATGLPLVDAQHRQLVSWLNLLARHVAFKADSKLLEDILDGLVDYTHYHFQTEEAVWRNCLGSDDAVENHLAAHAGFLDTVHGLKEKLQHGSIAELAQETLSYLTRWLAEHILRNDLYMACLVLAVESGKSLPEAKLEATVKMGGTTRALTDIILSIYGTLTSNALNLMHELSERKLVEERLRESETFNHAILNSIKSEIVVLNRDGAIVAVNEAWKRFGSENLPASGRQPTHAGIGDNYLSAATCEPSVEGEPRALDGILAVIEGRLPTFTMEYPCDSPTEKRWFSMCVTPIGAGSQTGVVVVHTDITQRKLAEEEIKSLAFYDTLTRLPNRRLLLDRLRQSLGSLNRNGRQSALLFIDLDHFKAVNDNLGHDAGDQLLQSVASRTAKCVRAEDTVARLGGDEFVVMLSNLDNQVDKARVQVCAVAEKIQRALHEPHLLNGHIHQGTASIGATLFDGSVASAEDVLKRADIAMYQAKVAGGNGIQMFQATAPTPMQTA